MQPAIALLEQFRDEDAHWILQTAAEQDVAQGETLVGVGEPVDALHVVVQGLFGVFADEVETQIAVLGPGDLVGELSFLTGEPPTEAVRALEHSTTLVLPHAALRSRAEHEPSFSARLHRALAQLLAVRLKAANRRLAVETRTDAAARQDSPAWLRLSEPLQEFKRAILAANEAAAKNHDVVPEDISAEMLERFLGFCVLLNEVMSQDIDNERVREEVGLRVQQEFLPYLLLTETAERFYSKPRGYAGDFWTIELLYRNQPGGNGAVGRVIDRCFLELPAARSVRHRRGLLSEEIDRAVRSRQGETARVTSLACGPAREVFDAFAAREDPAELYATLLDIDLQALAYVADQARAKGLDKRIALVSENLIRLALGKAETTVRDQDLVYSIGLIDYLGDELVVRLLDLVHGMLRPGGRVILGNVHVRNPSKAVMDHVLDWRLVHRTEDDMNRLFQSSAFGRPSTSIRFEDEGLNMFVECVR